MLKVLIIDDEKLVRQMVMRCISWEEIGLEVVGEASSVRMGMELLEELKPDIIFMDVRMPGMTGLEGSRLILEKYPYIKILILSGHDEFEYASEGIRVGVFDYLLKPINASELRKAAVKVKEAILEERNHRMEFERFKEELDKHSCYIKDRQLSALVQSRTPEQYLGSLSYFGIEINNTVFQVALVEIRVKESKSYEEEKLFMKMHARKIVEDYYGSMPGIFVSDSGADWIILLNNESENAIYDHGDDLKRYLENNTDCQVSIGVGNVYKNLEQTRESYREAKDAMKYHFVSGEEEVIYFRDIYPYYETDSAVGVNEDVMYELGNAVRIGNQTEAQRVLDEIMEQMKKTGGEREKIIVYAVQLLVEIMKVLIELKVDIQKDMPNYSSIIKNVFEETNFEDIREYLENTVGDACRIIGNEVSDKEKSLVHKAEDYLKTHYTQEDISLNALAQMYFVNSSYLSRVFKEKTGNTFTGYLFEIRMKEAEKLVLSTDLKAYEIAERVGIADPHYFSACFKRYTGMSVGEFKKSKK